MIRHWWLFVWVGLIGFGMWVVLSPRTVHAKLEEKEPSDIGKMSSSDLVDSFKETAFDSLSTKQIIAIRGVMEKTASFTLDQLKDLRAVVEKGITKEQKRYTNETKDLKGDAATSSNQRNAALTNLGKANTALLSNLTSRLASSVSVNDLGNTTVEALKNLENADKIAGLVAKYDHALLGQYVQNKLERLLGSKEFCVAVKEGCGDDKAKTENRKAPVLA